MAEIMIFNWSSGAQTQPDDEDTLNEEEYLLLNLKILPPSSYLIKKHKYISCQQRNTLAKRNLAKIKDMF